jgi:DNA-binding CsgD family transcriptional regulator
MSKKYHPFSGNTFEAFRKLWNNYNLKEKAEEFDMMHKNSPLLLTMTTFKDFCVVVVDISTMEYLYVSPSIELLFGWTVEEYMQGTVRFFHDKIHIDDKPGLITMGKIFNDYYVSLPMNERKNYQGFGDYRICKKDGTYTRLLQRDTILKTDEYGGMMLLLVSATAIDNYKMNDRHYCKVTNGKESILYRLSVPESQIFELEKLNKRELEIALLISSGFTSEEIAEKLYVSLYTVKTHRRNIFDKLHVTNAMEMINVLKIFGMI